MTRQILSAAAIILASFVALQSHAESPDRTAFEQYHQAKQNFKEATDSKIMTNGHIVAERENFHAATNALMDEYIETKNLDLILWLAQDSGLYQVVSKTPSKTEKEGFVMHYALETVTRKVDIFTKSNGDHQIFVDEESN